MYQFWIKNNEGVVWEIV